MDNKRDQELLKALNQGLNRATENLDPSIQLRLQQARQKALLELNTQGLAKSQRGFAVWLNQLQFFNAKSSSVIAGALGALVLTLGVQVLMNHSSDNSLVNSELKPNNSTDVLMSNEDIEFLENMDMYEWLAAEYS